MYMVHNRCACGRECALALTGTGMVSLGLGLVVEDEPSELSCTMQCHNIITVDAGC